MAIEVFNRYEKKFFLNTATYLKFKEKLHPYMTLDDHNKNEKFYTISNIYYDTLDSELIKHSLSKPAYKEKLRLRAYGVPDEDTKVFLEIKKKVNKIVNKRRTRLTLKEAYEFADCSIAPKIKSYMNEQVVNEIKYFLSVYDVSPMLYLAYDRLAFFGKEDPNLRISFDTNIRTRRHNLRLELGDYGEKLLEDDLWLMEIKTEKSIPIWLTTLLSEMNIYSTNFSKYGKEYDNYIRRKKIICSTFYSPLQQKQHLPLQQQLQRS